MGSSNLEGGFLEGPLSRSTQPSLGTTVQVDCIVAGHIPAPASGVIQGRVRAGYAARVGTESQHCPPPGRRRPGVLSEEVRDPPEHGTKVSCSWINSIFGGPLHRRCPPTATRSSDDRGTHKGITKPEGNPAPRVGKRTTGKAGEENLPGALSENQCTPSVLQPGNGKIKRRDPRTAGHGNRGKPEDLRGVVTKNPRRRGAGTGPGEGVRTRPRRR